ncbi:MAG: agmatine deiminase family protein [Candidatus Sumerlaeaceae bacterium]
MGSAKVKRPAEVELPGRLGYRMPAEWEPHQATWIAWPHNVKDWPGRFAPIPWVYAGIVRQITRDEMVHILIDRDAEDKARRLLVKMGVDLKLVRFFTIETDRVWVRDFGPIFVVKDGRGGSRSVGMTNWHFNAWAKYDDWKRDDAVPDQLARKLKVDQWKPVSGDPERRIVLEGGSIDVNGSGLLLTTEECLLSEVQQRNAGMSRQQIENSMADYLGIQKVLWLRNGIAGDDTHGHVDDLARFTDASTIAIVSEPDKSDVNHDPLKENLALLQKMRDLKGRPFRIVTLPMPEPVIFEGQRLPASYANFYITNGSVLVPTFNDKSDRVALATLQGMFPKRRVVGIHCLELVWGLGTLHCMTQQQPKG